MDQQTLTPTQAVKVSLEHTFAKSKATVKGTLHDGGRMTMVVPEITWDQIADIDYLVKVHKLAVLLKRSGTGISINLIKGTDVGASARLVYFDREEVKPLKMKLSEYFPDNSIAISATREGVVGYQIKQKKFSDQDLEFLTQFCKKHHCQYASEPVRGGVEINIFR